ncbi:MAG TPA: hypothetical protein VMZ31_08140 [Phycisphaerae bacterium]|nr:hypothetical protein [Phycisphaerae bacterium]
MQEPIRIMPHHFVDIVRAHFSTGQVPSSGKLGHDVDRVVARLLDDRDAVLEIALGSDDICTPCAYFAGGRCNNTIDTSVRKGAPPLMSNYNLLIDERWCRRLDLSEGDQLTARQFCRRLQDHVGDIGSIYTETPAATRTQWAEGLEKGIAAYLA